MPGKRHSPQAGNHWKKPIGSRETPARSQKNERRPHGQAQPSPTAKFHTAATKEKQKTKRKKQSK